jgi:hypothetical protein
MHRLTISLCLAAAVAAVGPAPQAQTAEPKPAAVTAACPPSTTLEELTKALDDAISGPADKDRTCLRDLLLPEARLTPIRKEADGTFGPRVLTVEDWINAVSKSGRTVLIERQVKVLPETYGHLAHLWSTYEIVTKQDGPPEVTGINSIQAVNDGKRWRVFSILWEPDTTAGPVPEKYKP